MAANKLSLLPPPIIAPLNVTLGIARIMFALIGALAIFTARHKTIFGL